MKAPRILHHDFLPSLKKLASEPYSAFEPHIAASAYGWLSD
jgi:hypothetical protein